MNTDQHYFLDKSSPLEPRPIIEIQKKENGPWEEWSTRYLTLVISANPGIECLNGKYVGVLNKHTISLSIESPGASFEIFDLRYPGRPSYREQEADMGRCPVCSIDEEGEIS
jgi:hypothetical protein